MALTPALRLPSHLLLAFNCGLPAALDRHLGPRRQALVGTRLLALTRAAVVRGEAELGRELGVDTGEASNGPGTAGQGQLDRGQQTEQRNDHLHTTQQSQSTSPYCSVTPLLELVHRAQGSTEADAPLRSAQKTGDMATGAVSFFNDKLVKRIYVPARENAIVNRLNKTKVVREVRLRFLLFSAAN